MVREPSPNNPNILCEINQLLDLAALSVDATRDMEITARHRSLKQARLQAVKADLRIKALHGDISLSLLAKRHGMSPGYIRDMFEQEGQSLNDYVLGLRLVPVYQCLSSPAYAHTKVAAIIYDAGFNNPSWFYCAFKRRFGLTLGEVRELANTALHTGMPA